MKKLTGILVAMGIAAGGWWGIGAPPPIAPKDTIIQATKTQIGRQIDIPDRIIIPKLNVAAKIETAGLDKSGRMDVPKNVSNAAWYELGAKPGEKGNAVIAGHLNNQQLKPEIFYSLATLVPGDRVYIEDKSGQEWKFEVKRVAELPDKNFPIEEVFGDSNRKKLNLITCGGKWDKKLGTFDKRTVAFTELTEN